MKKYKILAESITGFKGKQLLKGEIHPETEFNAGHCDELCNCGFMQEVTEPEEVKVKKTKEQPQNLN